MSHLLSFLCSPKPYILLSIGNFIYSSALFVIFYSFSDDANHVHLLHDTVDVELGIGSVTTVDADSLQSEKLFKDVTLFAEIHYTVQFYVVAASMEHAMLNDELFGSNDKLQLAEIETTVQHHQ